ncbi:hypothetical protein J2X69_001670 [Algoriphagus sp. 4150]|uniref:DUF4129 domain-containing protein n=1 Tax=Algoriphagus sp. 4150 TaxID=2817756 RepID=UPI002854A986|nr:DUF4129 domain-containing protein [Algoriphagus sp. 4150]MDR7129333.1 hypothetical protein [Algoriphagus sp. 4150]
MARIGLIALLFFLFQYRPVLAKQDILHAQDSMGTRLDSPSFTYHKAWSFEEGYADAYLSQAEYDYEEIRQEKNWLHRVKLWFTNAWNRFLERIWGGSALSGFWQVFFQLAPYLLLLMLMSLLVWLAMKYSSGASQDGKTALSSLSADEALLKSDNLKELEEEALRNQDFRLALRYRYLSVLQHLIRRKLIVWKSSKTNFDYQKELEETPFLAPFTEVTRIYNFVWYGHFDLDATTYGELEGAFSNLDQLS